MIFKYFHSFVLIIIISTLLITTNYKPASALTIDAKINSLIKKSGGQITISYENLITKDKLNYNVNTAMRAASTMKLPLALFVLEKAEQGSINLNQRLVYTSRHYYGGSGIIQNKKIGTSYTIRELIKYAIVHSDNIAFIMLKEKVGSGAFLNYLKTSGAKYGYVNGVATLSANDLNIFLKKAYTFSQKSKLGKELVNYLSNTVYNTTIPSGIPKIRVAHKVGMIPMYNIYNDAGLIFDNQPYTLVIMTKGIEYNKSQKVIAELASLIHKNHLITTSNVAIANTNINKNKLDPDFNKKKLNTNVNQRNPLNQNIMIRLREAYLIKSIFNSNVATIANYQINDLFKL
ncbi:MAG: penP [Bacillales bacterium]|jgi:beta-lactamase class A|nr:penP [Bacillales bacterium]